MTVAKTKQFSKTEHEETIQVPIDRNKVPHLCI